jgi:NADPH-dependent glutamate synthase beta subunit-like oxidoreductase
MKNNLCRGIRKASDFLMALQLTGAFKKPSMANLQVRLPALVMGGGLTAIDTATELMAYYPLQVEKALERFEGISKVMGEEATWAMCSPEEKETLKIFIEHGKAIREERAKAKKEKLPPLTKEDMEPAPKSTQVEPMKQEMAPETTDQPELKTTEDSAPNEAPPPLSNDSNLTIPTLEEKLN